MGPKERTAVAFAFVSLSLVTLFILPREFFIPATFAATSVMLAGAVYVGGFPSRPTPRAKPIALGAASAAALYGIFYMGNYTISQLGLPGLNASAEASIYSLIASPSNPVALQLAMLAFDAAGYESFFRETLQKRLHPRFGSGSAVIVAAADAGLHIATLNPLWVGTTFVADVVWGLTYKLGGGLQSSMASHFLWDVAIFLLRPIT